MTPEQRIAAFWEIWETNPDNIWQTSGAIQGLKSLSESLVAVPIMIPPIPGTRIIKISIRKFPKFC
ncbi:hypothetical protein [[Phormidium] sp. ETS-05]|uniref:hypothetical protein n=1 Tax=[Phormidium] sp. ETS-05 TaxID=222819 RepID=UPI0018EF2E6A|nr:hypothetical protein [[Phormidium] sp. ETS-05]